VTEAIRRFPGVPEPLPLARFSASDDLRAAIGLWAAWLAGERRASAHTVAAYGRDLAFFLDFLTEHLGELPSLAAINALRAADFQSVRGSFKFNRNQFPIQNYYLQVVSKGPDARIMHKTLGTVLTNRGDAYVDQCRMN